MVAYLKIKELILQYSKIRFFSSVHIKATCGEHFLNLTAKNDIMVAINKQAMKSSNGYLQFVVEDRCPHVWHRYPPLPETSLSPWLSWASEIESNYLIRGYHKFCFMIKTYSHECVKWDVLCGLSYSKLTKLEILAEMNVSVAAIEKV